MPKKSLLNETVIRRWGKLANMPALTENFIDSLPEEEMIEEEEIELREEDDEMEMEMEAGEDASPAEEEAVEKIVAAVVDAIQAETGVDIEVEGGADEGGEMEMDMDDDDPAMMDDPE